MTAIASPQNTAGQNLDPAVLASGTTGYLHRGLNSKATTGGDVNNVAQETGTHVDDAAFGIAVDTISAAGFLADETSPDSVDEGDAGAARMGLDRIQLVRQAGPHTSRAVAAVSVGTSATALPSSALTGRKRIVITNNDATLTLYVGTAGVTTSTGTPILPGGSYDEDGDVVLYGIGPSSTINTRVMELS